MEKKPYVGAGIQNTAPCSPVSDPLSWRLETQPEQHQQVPFSPPLSWSSPAGPQQGGEEGVGCCPSPRCPRSPVARSAAGGSGSGTRGESGCCSSGAAACADTNLAEFL